MEVEDVENASSVQTDQATYNGIETFHTNDEGRTEEKTGRQSEI